MRVVFVHGACVRNGSWWWHRTAELLQEQGVPSMVPALPSCGEVGLPGGVGGPGLPEDVAAVRQALQAGDEPTIAVAHSYGGNPPGLMTTAIRGVPLTTAIGLRTLLG